MIADRGTALVELDKLSLEPGQPYGIITIDGRDPHEYDDGIAVTRLDSASELYEVQVFAADSSSLYVDEDITNRVLTRLESRYRNEGTPEEQYSGMLPEELVAEHQFDEGSERSALVVSFIIGVDQPPIDISIDFGRVNVLKNFTYRRFGRVCRPSEEREPFGRVAALILHHLGAPKTPEDMISQRASAEAIYRRLISSSRGREARGVNINTPFMIAANHLAGRLVINDELAIFRVYDPEEAVSNEFIGSDLARYSAIPSQHRGLGVDVYTRVTSPLRRTEDFVMHGLLRARTDLRALDQRDYRITTEAIKRLNQRVAVQLFLGKQPPDEDHWIS